MSSDEGDSTSQLNENQEQSGDPGYSHHSEESINRTGKPLWEFRNISNFYNTHCFSIY